MNAENKNQTAKAKASRTGFFVVSIKELEEMLANARLLADRAQDTHPRPEIRCVVVKGEIDRARKGRPAQFSLRTMRSVLSDVEYHYCTDLPVRTEGGAL